MLYAKISPEAEVTKQISPFQLETIFCDYVSIIALNYTIGYPTTKFNVMYGNIIEGAFNCNLGTEVELTAEELSTWGTDDSVLFTIVGQKVGFSVVEIINI